MNMTPAESGSMWPSRISERSSDPKAADATSGASAVTSNTFQLYDRNPDLWSREADSHV